VPVEDRHRFHRWSNAVNVGRPFDLGTGEGCAEFSAAHALHPQASSRSGERTPRTTWMSTLAQAEEGSDTLSEG